ncbi:MAG: hypothetical protein HY814_09975 [Candidatus Riflebacteria bacterium]|nr:hypothetical protein [Candidatus Riflebacteria bacterium]
MSRERCPNARDNLPPEVIRVIESREVEWSDHAAESADRLGLDWSDVVELARTGEGWKREADEKGKAADGWKDSVSGRDTGGGALAVRG